MRERNKKGRGEEGMGVRKGKGRGDDWGRGKRKGKSKEHPQFLQQIYAPNFVSTNNCGW
jgi:hypothetical protein